MAQCIFFIYVLLILVCYIFKIPAHSLRNRSLAETKSRTPQNQFISYHILVSLVVRISACHVEGPGSIPGRGVIF